MQKTIMTHLHEETDKQDSPTNYVVFRSIHKVHLEAWMEDFTQRQASCNCFHFKDHKCSATVKATARSSTM